MAASRARTPGRAAFAFVFVTVMLDFLALGIIVPILPKLVIEFRRGDTASAATIVGIFGTVWAAMQFLCSPVLGALSDRFGRRTVILLSNFGLGIDYIFMAVAPSLEWLFVGRVISGITSASYATAGAYIADVTEPGQRAAKFGLLGAAFGIGFIIGPVVGGLAGSASLRLPFWIAAGLSLTNAAYGYFILPESLPPERRAPFHWRRAHPWGSIEFLRSMRLFGLAMAGFLAMLAHDSMPVMFVLYVDYRYGWTQRDVGFALAAVGVASLIVQGGIVGPLVSKLGERRAVFIGLAAGAIGMTIYALAPTGRLFFAGIMLTAFFGLVNPSLQGLMTRRVGPTAQGQLQGANGSLNGIASLVAPLLFTQLFAYAIAPERSLPLPGAPFLLAVLMLIGSGLVVWRVGATIVGAGLAPPGPSKLGPYEGPRDTA